MAKIEDIIRKSRARGKNDEPPYDSYQDAGYTQEIADLAREHDQLAGVIEKAEAEKRELSKKLQELLASRGRDRVRISENERLLAYLGKTSSISKERLLDQGVKLEQIELATNTREYVVVKLYRD
jgi:septal ring factor EnvC (AmiA/AmiB activator)